MTKFQMTQRAVSIDAFDRTMFQARDVRAAAMREMFGGWIASARHMIGETGVSAMPLAVTAAACLAIGPHWPAPNGLTMTVVLAAAVVSSIAGFAFSLICGAVLFHLVPNPVQAVQIMLVCSIANQAAMTWSLRKQIEWRQLSICLAGGAVGLTPGIELLLHANRSVYTALLGVFLMVYGVWMLARRPITVRTQNPAFDMIAGFLGGLTGGAVASPGAPVVIWCGCKGWDKTRQRALFQPFILIMQTASLVAIGLAGPATAAGKARST